MDKLECIATNGQTVIRLKHKPSGQPKRGMEGYHFEQEHLIYGFWGENPTCTTDCDIRCASHPGDSLEVFEKSTPRTYEVLTNDQLRINQPSSGNRVVLRIKSPKTLKNLGPYRTGWASRTAPGQKQWLLDIGDFVENIKPHEAKKMAGENVKVMKLDERSKTQVGNVRAFPVTLSTDELGMAQDIF